MEVFDAQITSWKNVDEAISLLRGVVKDEPQFAGADYFIGVDSDKMRGYAGSRSIRQRAPTPNFPEHERRWLNSTSPRFHRLGVVVSPGGSTQSPQYSGGHDFRRHLPQGRRGQSRHVFEAVAQALPNEAIGPYRLGLVARAEHARQGLCYFEEPAASDKSGRQPRAVCPSY